MYVCAVERCDFVIFAQQKNMNNNCEVKNGQSDLAQLWHSAWANPEREIIPFSESWQERRETGHGKKFTFSRKSARILCVGFVTDSHNGFETYHFLAGFVERSEEVVVSFVVVRWTLRFLAICGITRYGKRGRYPIPWDFQCDAVVVRNGMSGKRHRHSTINMTNTMRRNLPKKAHL